ncbi:MAG: hypothetical protein ACP5N2_02545 [Candidatus Nanoarchaeia archaeon]
MKGKTKFWLAFIFFAVVALRLIIVFQTKGLDYEAYSVIRQVESIHDTGLPVFNDNLSYSGRTHIFSPVYHYFLAGFTFILPVEIVAKVIPNLLAALTVLVVFLFAFYFTKDDLVSLVMAGISGIIPLYFDSTLNNASIYSAVIPLFMLTAYFFVQTHKDAKHIWKLIISMIVLTFLHPASLILMFCFLIYIFLINLENFRKSYRETELVLFFLFMVFWANMTLYKRALLAHGDSVVFQNIPSEIVSNSFKNITFLESIYSVGVIPLIFGLMAIYAALFVSNSKSLMLVTSISLGMFVLLWFKLISLDIGLMILSISLMVLAAYSIGRSYEGMKMAKLKNAHIYFLVMLLVVSVALFIPALIYAQHNTPSNSDIDAMHWMSNHTESDSVILALPEEGSAVSYFSERKNVMDDDYLMIKNVNTRYEDIQKIYMEDRFITTALERLNYYSVDYIFLSEYNQEKNNLTSLAFYDASCFKQVYPEETNTKEDGENIKKNGAEQEDMSENEDLSSGPMTDEDQKSFAKIYKVNCKLLSKTKDGTIKN